MTAMPTMRTPPPGRDLPNANGPSQAWVRLGRQLIAVACLLAVLPGTTAEAQADGAGSGSRSEVAESNDSADGSQASVAAVEPDPSQALLAEAVREYGAGSYNEAYALLRRAYEAQPTARVERVLGMTAFALRNYREAIDWLERSLATSVRPLTTDMREDVESLLARARSFLGHFEVHTSVPGARVDVDGEPFEGTELVLDLGEHELVARAEGYEPTTRRVHVRGGEQETISIELVRLVAATAEDPGALHRRLGIASMAGAGAFLIAGVVANVIWSDAVSTLNVNLEAGACAADPESEDVLPGGAPECYDLENRYRLTLPFIWIGYVGAGAFLAAGIALLAGAPSDDDDEQAVACGPFAQLGVSCVGHF